MKFIILTQYYPPESGAPQRRLSELAERMVKAGHQVTVLTAMPNYPEGKLMSGYGGLLRRETLNGVSVIRTFIYPTKSAGIIKRLANYFSFVLSSLLFGTFLLPRADYLMVESPPLFLSLSAIWLSRLKRARMIFNVSDLWPDTAVWLGVIREDSLSYKISARLESLSYRLAWLITGQNAGIVSDINKRFPHRPTYLLTNGADVQQFRPDCRDPETRAELVEEGQVFVLYAGLFGLAQNLRQVLDAAHRLRDLSDIRIVLVGDGPEKADLLDYAAAQKLDNVRFVDRRPPADMPSLLASADMILVPLSAQMPDAAPSKLFEAMASGRPIILAGKGSGTDIIEQGHAGIVVPPDNPEALAQAIRRLHDDPALREQLGVDGRRAAEERFSRDQIAAQFMAYLEQKRGET